MAVTEVFQNAATIGATEHYLTANSTTQTLQTTDGIYQVILDASALADGDIFRIRGYEKVTSGGTVRLWLEEFIKPGDSHVFLPPVILLNGWDFSLTKMTGTDRSIPWSIRKVGDGSVYEENSATIGTTEYFVGVPGTSASYDVSDNTIQLWLDLNAMTASEHYRLICYEKVSSGGTARNYHERNYYGVQVCPNQVLPAFSLMHGWDFSLDKIAGTDRSILWSIRKVGT